MDWFACLRVVAGCAGPNFALSLCAAATVQLLALPCSASSIQTAQVEMEETEHCVHHLESDQTALLRCRNPSRRGEPAQLMQLASRAYYYSAALTSMPTSGPSCRPSCRPLPSSPSQTASSVPSWGPPTRQGNPHPRKAPARESSTHIAYRQTLGLPAMACALKQCRRRAGHRHRQRRPA